MIRAGNRLHSFCEASLKAPNPTMMVVPDTLADSRFQQSQFVAAEPFVRFYAGAPLVRRLVVGLSVGRLSALGRDGLFL
jgi:GAF domain-containing protein